MKFQSKYPSYRIVVKPAKYLLNAYGDKVFEKGISAEFENGFFETEDEEVINTLKQDRFYGIDFWSVDEPASLTQEAVETKNEIEEAKQELTTDCPICGKNFKTINALKGHIRFGHKQSI